MTQPFTLPTTILLLAVLSLQAKPVLELDTREFDCGSVIEGKTDKIEAKFTIKNSGDEPLKLLSVKPSCGCTVVKYDSVIQPGASTTIASTVNIKGRRGLLSKAVTITSNAESDSIVRVIIKANIIEVLQASIGAIDMTGDNQTKNVTLQLTSNKKDLKVNDITFTPNTKNDKDKSSEVASKVTFTLQTIDTTRTDGLVAYRLELQPLMLETAVDGKFVVSTNHPDRKELTIQGKVGK